MRNLRGITPARAVSLLAIFALFLAPTLLAQAPAAPVEDWRTAAQALGRRLAQRLKTGQSVALALQNLSSLAADDAVVVQREIEAELQAEGRHVITSRGITATGSEEGVAEVRLTLAENAQGFLWVAEVSKGEEREVVMQAAPRAEAAGASASTPAMLLQSQMLLSQETPILDFALLGLPASAAKQMLVLEPARVGLYTLGPAGWQLAQIAAIPPPDPPQRDLRGWLRIYSSPPNKNGNIPANESSFSVFLPGEICGGVWDPLALKCAYSSTSRRPWDEDSGADWPSFPLESERDTGAHSTARIQVKGKAMEIAAGKDGVARLYRYESAAPPYGADERKGSIATITGWGSDVAGIKSGCGSGWQVLATRTGDWTERDAVQAFEIEGKRAVPESPPLEFPGPVMAMQASENEDIAFAVIRNLQTGRYEAHVLTVSCGR